MPATQEQLFKQQQAMNQAMSLASGIGGLYNQASSMIGEAKQINTTAPTPMMNSFGKPMYNLGSFASQVSAIKPQGATGGELLNGVMTGAQAGAEFGGATGAIIGGVVGGVSSALAGRRRKTLQERRRTLANNNLLMAQRAYNTGITSYNNAQAAQSLYNDTVGTNERRINNVYQALS